MPIENIKIIRDGEIIQTTGIDGLLLEKVGIYEYLNLTKKIYEGNSLTIQIKDSTSVTYAVYKEGKLSLLKKIVTKFNKEFSLQYEKDVGLKISTEDMSKLSDEEYSFLSKETKSFKKGLYQIKNYFDQSDLENKESGISRLLNFYYVFYKQCITTFDEETNKRIQEMSALLNYLGVNVIGTEFDYSLDKQSDLIISQELQTLLEESFYINITKPESLDMTDELIYIDTLRNLIFDQLPKNMDFFGQVCSLNKYLYNAILTENQDQILETVSEILKTKKA